MEHQTKKLTLTQKVAIYWLKNMGSPLIPPLILYKQLKSLPRAFRLFLYTALIGYSYFALKFASSLIGGYFDTAPMSEVWYFLGDIIFYGVITGLLLIFTLESLNDIDIPQIFADIKQKQVDIKAQKLQRWRLRNMNIFVRILLYISFYVFCLFIIYMSSLGLYINIFSGAAAKPYMNEFEELVINFIRWFTFVYLASGLTLEYFVNKVQRSKEVQNETVTA